MNRAIWKLFVVLIGLFAILIVFTSRWTVLEQSSLKSNSLNKLSLYASWKVKRGEILADDGTVLASSVSAGGGTWKRVYPFGSSGLFSQTVGYANVQEGQQAGLEAFYADALSGQSNGVSSLLGLNSGQASVGDDLYTTLSVKAQKLAQKLLDSAVSADGATAGSVIAIDPQTGAVKVMYSDPSYNSNDPFGPCKPAGSACQLDNATQAELAPGSTFKLVTTTAALNSGKYTPESTFNGPSPLTVSGKPLENDGNISYYDTSLTKALTYSINTIYAQVGQNVGRNVMQQYMERFGFYSTLPLDLPSEDMLVSGERFSPGTCANNKQTLLLPVTNSCVDIGRTAIGQANLTVTPFQMAMVVSAIANDGKLMVPHLGSRVVNQDGQVVQRVTPTLFDQVMTSKVAVELQGMMRDVVEEGTGTAANLEGLPIAGKTGTATTYTKDGVPYDNAWFVGFPEQNPDIAVVVELSNIPNGYGGTYAAPIAAKMITCLTGGSCE